MKNWQHIIILIIATTFLTGCSLCTPQIKTVIAEVEPFKFLPIEVNLSEVREVEKISLDGKLWFENDSNSSVCMGVDTWSKIRRAKRDESLANKRLRLQNLMLNKANDGNLKQIKRYEELHSELKR